jgi:PEP-CTERM motif
MKILLALAVLIFPSIALAAPITFNLRDPAIELIDEVNSFSLTQGGLTATLFALPATFNEPPLRTLELNQTSSSFGVNVAGTTCGGLEDSSLIDGGCTPESVAVTFNLPVRLDQIVLSLFTGGTTGDLASLTIDGFAPITLLPTPAATDIYNFSSNNTVPAGQAVVLGYLAGNGFSFDSFTVTAVPEPTSLILLGIGWLAMGIGALRRRKLIS